MNLVVSADPAVSNFSSFFNQMSDQTFESPIRSLLNTKLNATTNQLIFDLQQVPHPSDTQPNWMAKATAELQGCLFPQHCTNQPKQPSLAPYDRKCLRIRPHNERAAGSELSQRGDRKALYVSRNELVSHQDARCTKPDEQCTFALCRVFLGYLMEHPGLERLGRDCVDPACDVPPECPLPGQDAATSDVSSQCRLLKGEAVDVSVPLRFDVNLELYCEEERTHPGRCEPTKNRFDCLCCCLGWLSCCGVTLYARMNI